MKHRLGPCFSSIGLCALSGDVRRSRGTTCKVGPRFRRALGIAAGLLVSAWLPSAGAQIYVADNGMSTSGGVAAFASGASGNVLPDMTLTGSSTGINTGASPIWAVVANSTNLFVLCNDFSTPAGQPFILKYSLPTSGNAAPVSTTYLKPSGVGATYDFATALAIDGTNLYVLDNGSGVGAALGAVNVYPLSSLTGATSGSPLAATRTIAGATNTTLNRPNGITVDGTSIYVANTQGGNLLVFALAASGDVAPAKSITGLSVPVGVAVDATTIYSLNSGNGTVTTYPVGTAGGAVAATTTIGSTAITTGVFYVALDASNIYVGDNGDILGTPAPSVFVFPKATNSATATPSATIAGTSALQVISGVFVLAPPATAAPTVSGGGSTAFTIGGGPVAVNNAVTLTAVPGTLATATIQITGAFQTAEDVLAFTNNNTTNFGNIAGVYNATLGILRLVSNGATATKAQWQNALQAVTYNNTAGSPNTASRTVSTKVFDGAQSSASATRTITLFSAPTIASVTAPANGTYAAGQALNFTVNFSSAVTVTGTPSIAVTVGSGSRSATFAGGSGTTTLTFRYTVVLGDNAPGGIAIASPITLNGGTINATSGAAAAVLTFTPPTTTSIVVSTVPILAATAGATGFTSADNAASTPVAVDSGITLTDPSLASFPSSGYALVTITGNYQSGADVLNLVNVPATMGDIQGVFSATAGFVPAGTLVLNSASGTATIAQWQAALRAITFTNSAIMPATASRTVSFLVNDGVQNSNTVTKSVTVTAVNQTPVVTTTSGSTVAVGGGPAVVIDSGVTVTDRNNTTLATATVSFNGNFTPSEDVLSFTNDGATMGNIAVLGSFDTVTGILALQSSGATATLAQWQAALRAVKYRNTSTSPSTAGRPLLFIVNDGTTASAAATKTIAVSPQSSIVSVAAPASGTYKAGDALNFTVTFSSAVTVTGTPSIAVTVGSTSRTATYTSGSGTSTLTFRYTVVLGDNAPSGVAIASPIALNGGTITGVGSVAAILTFTPPTTTSIVVSTAPILAASAGSTAFTSADNAASTPVAVDSGITLTDPSLAALPASGGALVTITGNYQSGSDVLSLVNVPATMGDIQSAFIPTGGFFPAGTLILNSSSGTATIGQWQAALRAIKFTSTAVTPSTAARAISFVVNDGVQNSNTVTKTVTVTAVNQTPIVTASSGSSSFIYPGGAIAVDGGVTVSDLDSATFASATAAITGGFQSAEDALAFTANASTMGNIAGSYNSTTGVVTLTSAGATATVTQWQAALRAITYNNTASPPNASSRTISFIVNDGVASSAAATKTVAVSVQPVIATVAPAYGAANTPVIIALTGQNFGTSAANITITYGPDGTGSTATNVALSSATAASATIGANVPGGTSVRFVITVNGVSSTPSSATFTGVNLPTITSVDAVSGTVGMPFTYAITTASPADTFTASGLPAGLTFDSAHGVIGGAPTAAGSTYVTLAASKNGLTSAKTIKITIDLPATTTTVANASAIYGAASVAFTASITSAAGPVSSGTVTFTLKNGSTTLGSAVTSGTVASGTATASYTLPAGTAVGSYVIQATYNATGAFALSSGSGSLTVTAVPTTTAASGEFTIRKETQYITTIADGHYSFAPLGLTIAANGTLYWQGVTGGGSFGFFSTTNALVPDSSKAFSSASTQYIAGYFGPTAMAVDSTTTPATLYGYYGGNGLTRPPPWRGDIYKAKAAAQNSTADDLVNLTPTQLTSGLAINGDSGFDLVLGAFGTLLYYTQEDKILAVPTRGGDVVTVIPSGSGLSPNTGHIKADFFGTLFVGEHGGNRVFKVDPVKKTVTNLTANVPQGGIATISGLAVNPLTDEVYIACNGGIKKLANEGTISDFLPSTITVTIGGTATSIRSYSNLAIAGDGALCFVAVNARTNENIICRTVSRNVVSLTAKVTSNGGTITDGKVKFTLLDGTKSVGTPVLADVKNGVATVFYPLAADQKASSYTIQAEYTPASGGTFAASSDKTAQLTPTEQQKTLIGFGFFANVGSAFLSSGDGEHHRAAAAAPSSLAVVLNPDGTTGSLFGYIAGINAGFNVNIRIDDDNTFSGQTRALTSSTGNGQTLTFRGSIANGQVSGSVQELDLSFSATVDPAAGASASSAGLYTASARNAGDGTTYSIVGTQGQVFSLALTPTGVAAGTGAITTAGTYTVTTTQGATITGTVDVTTGATAATVTQPGGSTITMSGVSTSVPDAHRLANLSILSSAGGGQVITAGFVVAGPKAILARAIGPSLSQFGVTSPQAAPTLTVFDSSGKPVVTNSGWAGDSTLAAAFAQVGAFTLAATSRDAAAMTTLPPGNYTLQVTGGAASGRALAELYDLDPLGSPTNSNLINLSSLGPVAGSATPLVAGFVIDGNSPRTVLIRGIGPSLTQFGVTGALATPLLKVFDGTATLIAQNQAWGTPVTIGTAQPPVTASVMASAAASVGAFALPNGSNDSAVLVTLAPGSYTVQISGANNASGTSLIEIYGLP